LGSSHAIRLAHDLLAFAKAAGDVEDEGHREVSGIVRKHPGRVRDHDALRLGSGKVDMVDACAIAGDELEPGRGGRDNLCIDTVCDRRYKNVAIGHRGDQCVTA